jgi:hypothetical protein
MQTRTALKQLTKGQIDVDRVSPGGPLTQNAGWLLQQYEKRQADIRASQQRHAAVAAAPMMHAARQKAEQVLRKQVMPNDMPIVSRYDAFSVVKDAARKHQDDMGLRKFALHLERLWHAEPLGSLTVGALSRLRDHYQSTSPRSIIGEVVDTAIPKVSFKTLPVSKLARLAAAIGTQEDYDNVVVRYGLQGDDRISVRARTFIRELVNRAASLDVGGIKDADTQEIQPNKAIKDPRKLDIKKIHGKDIAARIASRLSKDAAEFDACMDSEKEAAGPVEEDADVQAAPGEMPEEKKDPDETMGIEGTGVLPHAAAKDGAGKANFDPKINAQQPDQVAVPEDGCCALENEGENKQLRPSRKAAIEATHPLCDDGREHFPISTDELASTSLKTAQSMVKVPSWWLGSVDELKQIVQHAIEFKNKEAALPPGLEKFKFKKKTDGGGKSEEKDEKPGKKDDKKSGNPFAKDKKAFSLDKDTIEKALLEGTTFKAAGYSILINEKDDAVNISTKTGNKKYPLVELDDAIADFMYLASTAKHPAGSPPPPVFFVREGIRMNCPGCYETNSYEMPETAADLNCGSCNAVIPGKVVAAALASGAAHEEATLIAITPNELQEEFGDKFAKAAEIIGADGVGADGCRAEAYAVDVPVEKMAEVWDFMVQAGFTPIAQEFPIEEETEEPAMEENLSPTHEMEEGEELEAAERLEGIAEEVLEIADEIEGMEHHGQAGMPPPSSSAPAGAPGGGGMMAADEPGMPGADPMMGGVPGGGLGGQWSDWQVIQAAMMHYQHQGMGVADAISQFQKDYAKERKDEKGNPIAAQEFDQQVVIQVASQVFGVDGGQLGDSMALGMDMTPPGEAGPEVEAPVPEDLGDELPGEPPAKEMPPAKRSMAKKKKADLPSTKVNQQQPDAVQVSKLGPDTEQTGQLPSPGKIKTQTGKPQGNFAETGHEPDSDRKDPGTFGAGKPKAQHPITDQRGVKLPSTEMGKDSDTGDNAVTRKMEQMSGAAPQSMQSK